MATAASVTTDLTTCSICLEMFDDPKSLPCLHAFCLKCLEGYFNDKHPGDEVPCPLCKREFQIPPDGPGGLQHHFIVQRLVDVRKASIEETVGVWCNKHNDERVKLYCCDCDENTCVVCYAVNHKHHESAEIPTVARTFSQQIRSDVQQVWSLIHDVKENIPINKEKRNEFLRQADRVKSEITAVGNQIKEIVDNQVAMQLNEVEMIKSEDEQEAETVEEHYQLALVEMESFHRYSHELLDKGRPSDITGAASELHKRATELLDNDVTSVQYCPRHVTFTPADVTQLKHLNLIGEVNVEDETQPGTSYFT